MKPVVYTRAQQLPAILARRIAILDGAMGTMIQRFKLSEAQYRGQGYDGPGSVGERFTDFGRDVKGNNELLSLTRPDVIRDIHEAYLAAGADLVVHQRDQGRDHHRHAVAGALARDRRDLVAQRLAAARGHQHQRVAAVRHVVDDGGLGAAELVVAEDLVEDVGGGLGRPGFRGGGEGG